MWFTVVTGAVPRQILSRINAANTKVYEYLRTRCAVSWSCITFCCYVYGRRYSATRAFTSKVSLFFKLNVKRWRMCACHHSCVLLYECMCMCVCWNTWKYVCVRTTTLTFTCIACRIADMHACLFLNGANGFQWTCVWNGFSVCCHRVFLTPVSHVCACVFFVISAQ